MLSHTQSTSASTAAKPLFFGETHRRSNVVFTCLRVALALLATAAVAQDFTLVTVDPGHFHAALFQREMLPGVADEAYLYAPLGPDLLAHLQRLAAFNARSEQPTHWRLRLYTGPDFLSRMLEERPGQIVVLSGRNRGKMDRIARCIQAGLHVLADKPWILEEEELPGLQAALDRAQAGHVVAYDAMTQRFEVTAQLQRALVTNPEVFGTPLPGSLEDPGVSATSVHYLCKEVAGVVNLRPAWFFNSAEQGEGLTDVGTHLVDMVQWILFPTEILRPVVDVQVLRGTRWPTSVSGPDFERVTGEKAFPVSLQSDCAQGKLQYYGNNTVDYALRGIHIRLKTVWDVAAPPGQQDTEQISFRGSRARVEVRQDSAHGYRRQVHVLANSESEIPALRLALRQQIAIPTREWPGLALDETGPSFRIVIPDQDRASHERHFALLAERFLNYARHPETLPSWEKAAMLAKYYVTTRGVALGRTSLQTP